MENQLNPLLRNTFLLTLALMIAFSSVSCKKYLEEKSDKKISTPSTVTDLEGILDNYSTLNARYPSAPEISADNYYLTNGDWANLPERQRNLYLWQKYDDIGGDWSAPFNNIFYANVILEVLNDLHLPVDSRTDQVKGSALFIRSLNHFILAGLFAVPYDPVSADQDLGIPIRLKSDPNIVPVRVSNSLTYMSIIDDATRSASLLSTDLTMKYRPNRLAAYALLARVYLSMNIFDKAELYADSCLKLYGKLIDYNTITANSAIPFQQFNDEVIYDARTISPSALSASRAKIDSNLIASYQPNDLRLQIFFKKNADGTRAFKGNYTGSSSASLFAGFATDEIYLIRAECRARRGDTSGAMEDLNLLLNTRWKIDPVTQKSTYVDQTASTKGEALDKILVERRKELLFRNIRWSDLRRLNQDRGTAQSIFRRMNNKTEELAPKSNRYTLQIDRQAVNLSGLVQNP